MLHLTDIVQPLSIELQSPVWVDLNRFVTNRYTADFDILLTNGKPLQRPLVWTLDQKRSLITSMLKQIYLQDIVAITDFEDTAKTYKIVDGKQRLSTILSFIRGEFTYLHNDKEYTFADFDNDAQRSILRPNGLRFQLVIFDEANPYTDSDLIQLFDRLNYSGTPQEASHIESLKQSITI